MSDIVNYYGIRRNRNTRYLCPFHDDHNPDATISKDDKWFKCFACGVNVNAIDFVAKYDNCDRKTAIAKIDEMFGLGLGGGLTEDQRAEIRIAQQKREREKQQRALEEKREREALDLIVAELNLWQSIQQACHPTRGEIRRDDWQLQDLFLHAVEEQEWLTWLFARICGIKHGTCEYDFSSVAMLQKTEIVEKVLKKEILNFFEI